MPFSISALIFSWVRSATVTNNAALVDPIIIHSRFPAPDNCSHKALIITPDTSSGWITVSHDASSLLSELCNPKAFLIAMPRLKCKFINSSSCRVARAIFCSSSKTIISLSTASSKVSGNYRGRTASYPTAPSQIPACGITAQGSSKLLASHTAFFFMPLCYPPQWGLHILSKSACPVCVSFVDYTTLSTPSPCNRFSRLRNVSMTLRHQVGLFSV